MEVITTNPSGSLLGMVDAILSRPEPTTTMTPKPEVVRALNQLISLVAGKRAAVLTNELEEQPDERIREITKLVTAEVLEATTTGDVKALKQCQRKIDSLTSLKTLAKVLMDEVIWED